MIISKETAKASRTDRKKYPKFLYQSVSLKESEMRKIMLNIQCSTHHKSISMS